MEIERESRSLSMLILSSTISMEWSSIIQDMLSGLVDKSGVWAKELITGIEREGIVIKKLNTVGKVLYIKLNYYLKS